jgi:hypothetical protein
VDHTAVDLSGHLADFDAGFFAGGGLAGLADLLKDDDLPIFDPGEVRLSPRVRGSRQ